MRRVLLIAVVILGVVTGAHPQSAVLPPTTAFCLAQQRLVDQYIGPLVKPPLATSSDTLKAVGAVVVTLQLGQQACFMSSGEIELGSGVAPDANTIFELASVTKVFTTAILGIRAASGDLDVNAQVEPYLPHRYHLLMNEQGVTFQQLATFTGGFSWNDPPGFKNGERYPQSAFIEQVNSLDPTVPIKKKAKGPISDDSPLPTFNFYSNGSTGFLGQILMHMDSKKNGQRYPFHPKGFSDWIAANLTGRLNMPNTAVHPGGVLAQGYAYGAGRCSADTAYCQEPPFLWEPWGAAGALRSNAVDMQKFLAANICAHHINDPACAGLPQDVLAGLKTAHAPNKYTPPGTMPDPIIYIGDGSRVEQAYAWRYLTPPDPNPKNETPIISKDGGHPGFSTWIGFSPHKSYGVVILMNTGGINLINEGQDIIKHTP